MNQKKIYWARPITTYSRTHKDALDKLNNQRLNPEQQRLFDMHYDLHIKYSAVEKKVHDFLNESGYEVVDPGSQKVNDAFEVWRHESDENKANPMPFFESLTDVCDEIAFTCFDDELTHANVPNVKRRIGCGMVREINKVANRSKQGKVWSIEFFESFMATTAPCSVLRRQLVRWPIGLDAEDMCNNNTVVKSVLGVEAFTCLSYPQTKNLLLLQGYKSRSSKYKKGN